MSKLSSHLWNWFFFELTIFWLKTRKQKKTELKLQNYFEELSKFWEVFFFYLEKVLLLLHFSWIANVLRKEERKFR